MNAALGHSRRPAQPGGVDHRRGGDRLRAGPQPSRSGAHRAPVRRARAPGASSPPWPWSGRSSPTTSPSPSWPPTTAGPTPLLYTITGMWSALAGSILLWGLILAGYIAAMVWRFRRQAADPLVGWATLVTLVVAAFFFGLMAGPVRPVPHRRRGRARQRARPQRPAAGQRRWWRSIRPSSIWLRRLHDPLRLRHRFAHHRDGSARVGSWRRAAGRCSRGRS